MRITKSFKTVSIPVTIVGVGYYDQLHNQRGMARNGREIHPVMQIQSYSGAVATQTQSFTISVNPNPAKERVAVQANVSQGDKLEDLEIIDAAGRKVFSQHLSTASADLYVEVNTRDFPEGAYFAIIRTPTAYSAKKFIIER